MRTMSGSVTLAAGLMGPVEFLKCLLSGFPLVREDLFGRLGTGGIFPFRSRIWKRFRKLRFDLTFPESLSGSALLVSLPALPRFGSTLFDVNCGPAIFALILSEPYAE